MDKTNQNKEIIHLCNNVLYVLTRCMYRGEDAHLVELSREFIKQLKTDIEKQALIPVPEKTDEKVIPLAEAKS